MSSRKIEDMISEMQALFGTFDEAMKAAGLEYMVTCTYRPQEEQDALYALGRTAPGTKVTWTLHSKHTERKAFDIAMIRLGKITWEPGPYVEAGKIGKAVGLKWGGDFSNPDRPHFEYKE
jgi:peptidoglycan LD-endopeptidase CwlK